MLATPVPNHLSLRGLGAPAPLAARTMEESHHNPPRHPPGGYLIKQSIPSAVSARAGHCQASFNSGKQKEKATAAGSVAVLLAMTRGLKLRPQRGPASCRTHRRGMLRAFSKSSPSCLAADKVSETPAEMWEEVLSKSFFRDWAQWLVDTFSKEFDAIDEEQVPVNLLARQGRNNSAIATRLLLLRDGSRELGRLRITLVDAGEQIQALNAAVYPNSMCGPLPLMGVDILSLGGGKRLLFGTDWSPLFSTAAYQDEYIAPFLSEWREQNSAFLEEPSTRFYGENPEFFSKCIFFSRPGNVDELQPGSDLWKVFQGYCERYAARLHAAEFTAEPEDVALVRERHAAYDQWHAERDPAIAVFKGLFGTDWTERFVTTVLFPGATCTESEEAE